MFSFLYFILTGAIIGWLAGKIIRGRGFGLFWNVVIGIFGAFTGDLLFQLTGLSYTHFVGKIIAGTLGALVFLFILSAFRSKKR